MHGRREYPLCPCLFLLQSDQQQSVPPFLHSSLSIMQSNSKFPQNPKCFSPLRSFSLSSSLLLSPNIPQSSPMTHWPHASSIAQLLNTPARHCAPSLDPLLLLWGSDVGLVGLRWRSRLDEEVGCKSFEELLIWVARNWGVWRATTRRSAAAIVTKRVVIVVRMMRRVVIWGLGWWWWWWQDIWFGEWSWALVAGCSKEGGSMGYEGLFGLMEVGGKGVRGKWGWEMRKF